MAVPAPAAATPDEVLPWRAAAARSLLAALPLAEALWAQTVAHVDSWYDV